MKIDIPKRDSSQAEAKHPVSSKPLARVEEALVRHAYKHRAAGPKPTGEALALALQGGNTESGEPLPYLPPSVCHIIASKLGTNASRALTMMSVNRLSAPSKRLLVQNAAKAYGFTQSPRAGAWEPHINKLKRSNTLVYRSINHIPASDAALAGLLTGTMAPKKAAKSHSTNRAVMLIALEQSGAVLKLARSEFCGDPEMVIRAVKQDWVSLRYARPDVCGNFEVVMHAVKQNAFALRFASAALLNDPEMILHAVKQNGFALQLASEALRDNLEVVTHAVKQQPFALQFASEALRNNPEVVMHALKKSAFAVGHASLALRDDPKFMTHIVKQNGLALQFCSRELRADIEVVTRAVTRNGLALQYASDDLRDDHDVVMAAVRQYGVAWEHASNRLKSDPEVCKQAQADLNEANRRRHKRIGTRQTDDSESG